MDIVTRHRYHLAVGIFIGLGVFLRVIHLTTRELDPDESWVVYSVMQPTLTGMLENIVVAPPLFSYLLFLSLKILPSSEFFLRLLPLLFSIGSLPLIYLLSLKITKSKTISLISLLLLAVCPWQIFYSRYVKQYSAETFFTISLLFVGTNVILGDRKLKNWTYFTYAFLIIVAPLFSFANIFITLAIAGLSLWRFLKTRDLKRLLINALPFLIAGILFFMAYLYLIKGQSENKAVLDYWEGKNGFPDLTSFVSFFKWLFINLNAILIEYSLGSKWVFPLWGLFVAGNIYLWRKKQRLALYSISSVILLLIFASFINKYPFSGSRLTLFTSPITFIILASGIRSLSNSFKKVHLKFLVIFATLLCFIPTFKDTFIQLRDTRGFGIRESVVFIENQVDEDDLIINFNLKDTLWNYYYLDKFGDTNAWDEPTRKNIGNFEKTKDLIENAEDSICIVMKTPWKGFRSRYEKKRRKLLNYLERNSIILAEFKDKQTEVYYVQPIIVQSEIKDS
ncbi:MAG: glycosyltransferase family 39 protein [Patescibacteria group bacterium]|nr:glycosyltransferase family 39 protein [Patescibacteria group bacterium]